MKKYMVRIYFTKFVDVEVEAENDDEAELEWELPHLDWYDKHDTSVSGVDVKEQEEEQ
jgi:hypothetical protein